MKKLIIAFVLCIYFSSCQYKTYSIVYLNSDCTTEKDSKCIFEDKNIVITYDFWSEGGELSFKIHNKSATSIFIDWSKCNFIANGHSFNYYQDKENIVTTGTNTQYNYLGHSYSPILSGGFSKSFTERIKADKVTHIPPNSEISESRFLLYPYTGIPNKYDIEFEAGHNITKKSFEDGYNQANSPFIFRNYLTYYTDDKLLSPVKIDHLFWASKVVFTNDNAKDKEKYLFNKDRYGYYDVKKPDGMSFYVFKKIVLHK